MSDMARRRMRRKRPDLKRAFVVSLIKRPLPILHSHGCSSSWCPPGEPDSFCIGVKDMGSDEFCAYLFPVLLSLARTRGALVPYHCGLQEALPFCFTNSISISCLLAFL